MNVYVDQIADQVYRIAVAPSDKFVFNHFLLVDDHNVLIHTGRVSWFPLVRNAVGKIIGAGNLNYIAFSHFEADECGALNLWLEWAPKAVPLVNAVGLASIEDYSIRQPQIIKDRETITLGAKSLLVLETPHFPHNWDACLFYETSLGILFSSDLGAHPGIREAISSEDRTAEILSFQREVGFMSEGRDLVRAIEKLEQLDIRYLATQHGSTICGPSITRLLQELKSNFGCDGSVLQSAGDSPRRGCDAC